MNYLKLCIINFSKYIIYMFGVCIITHCHHPHHWIQLLWCYYMLLSCSSLLATGSCTALWLGTCTVGGKLLFLHWSSSLDISSSSAAIGCTLTDCDSSIWFCWGGAGVASTADMTQEASLSPTDRREILQDGEEVFRILPRGPPLRPLVIMSGSERLLELVCDCLAFFCFGTVMPGIFLPQQNTRSQSFVCLS